MEIVRMNDEDLKSLYNFASSIWNECYQGVIPQKQIAFLVNKYFTYNNLLGFIGEGMNYFYLKNDNENIGFIAFEIKDEYVYLDKLYLVKSSRGNHLSAVVYEYLINNYSRPIRLNVNQNNKNAIKTYLANGFSIIKEEIIPLPDGLVNIYFVLEKKA